MEGYLLICDLVEAKKDKDFIERLKLLVLVTDQMPQ